MMNDFDEAPATIVAIPRPTWKILASVLAPFILAGLAAAMIWADLHLDPAEAARLSFAERWFKAVFAGIVAIIAPFMVLAWASYPEFEVGKEGIHLPTQRRLVRGSRWRMRDLGLYHWDEVSYCHWSHYKPGELNVQLAATRSLDGGPSCGEPPTRLYYRVPEPYRSDVEKAIRAFGKWAD